MGVMSLFSLEGRKALLTGASRGLGREMALAMAEAGADTVIVARERTALDRTAEELRRFGHEVGTIQRDIGRPADAENMAEQALEEFGPFDILVNNVGNRTIDVPTEDLSFEDWQRVVDLNLSHTFVCSKVIGRAMMERKRGKIINTASMSGLIINRGIHGRTYETAKAAVIPAFCLFQTMQISIQRFFIAPGSAINPLQHFIVRIAAPIGTSQFHQLECLAQLTR